MKDTRFHVESTEGPTPVEILPVVLLQYQKDVYLSFFLMHLLSLKSSYYEGLLYVFFKYIYILSYSSQTLDLIH